MPPTKFQLNPTYSSGGDVENVKSKQRTMDGRQTTGHKLTWSKAPGELKINMDMAGKGRNPWKQPSQQLARYSDYSFSFGSSVISYWLNQLVLMTVVFNTPFFLK